jgi:gas vesicle protein
MSANNNNENNEPHRARNYGIASKLMFFMIGGGIGAAIALLFAPKPGKELRQDIADAATKGYDETLEAANRVKEQSIEYLEAAKDKGSDMLDAVRLEIAEDAEKIGGMVTGAAKRVTESVKSRQIL